MGPDHIDTLNAMSFLVQLESLLGNHAETIRLLEQLLDRGWTGAVILDNRPFDSIRDDPRFRSLYDRARAELSLPDSTSPAQP